MYKLSQDLPTRRIGDKYKCGPMITHGYTVQYQQEFYRLTGDDTVTPLQQCASKTVLLTKDSRPTRSVQKRSSHDLTMLSGFPPMCPVVCTTINQIMVLLLGWVNILKNITIILQRGYLGSTDRHCKHIIENRSSQSSLECHKSLLFEVILLFSSIVYHCHHTMILL